MAEKYKRKVTRQKELVHVIPMGKDREFRFALVDVDGETAGDMRYFEKAKHEKDLMLPTKRGIPFPENPEAFLEGFEKLRKRLKAA